MNDRNGLDNSVAQFDSTQTRESSDLVSSAKAKIWEEYERILGPAKKPRIHTNDRARADKLFGAHVVDFLGDHMPWANVGRVAIQRFRPNQPCVYFIGGDTGAIKIGTTNAPLERLATFQLGSPIKLRILALTWGDRATESRYHTRFGDRHSHGEWFNPAPEILAEIDRLNEGVL